MLRSRNAIHRIRTELARRRAAAYGFAIANVGLAFAARRALDVILGTRQPFATFIIAVAVTAWFCGLGPSVLALVLGFLVGNWAFTPPSTRLSILDPHPVGVIGAALYLLVGGVITVLTESLRRAERRAEHEAAAARASEEWVAASQEHLRAFAVHVGSVRADERTRIARDLHDDLGQTLTVLKLRLASLERQLADPARDAPKNTLAERTAEMIQLVDQTVATVRRTANDLRSPLLNTAGLPDAIKGAAAEFQARTNLRCDVVLSEDLPQVANNVSMAVLRIAQEALTNVARHAQATRVGIALQVSGDDVVFEIADDGRGATLMQLEGRGSFGLLGMRERALHLGGEVTISGAPGRGVTIRARVPLGRAVADRRSDADDR